MATAQELEKLVVRLTGDGSDYYKMLKLAEKRTRESTDKMAGMMSSKLDNAGKALAKYGIGLTASVGLPVLAAIKAYANFDDAMTKSLAIMQGVNAAMRADMELTAKVIARGSTTSAKAAADAYFFLASAGMDAAASLAALPVVEKFAVAGAFDMAQATDLLTDAQSALGLSSKNAEENMKGLLTVSDTLVKANTLANASVQQFSEAITNEAGAAIRQYNMDLNEGVAILATYADQGLKGNAAGSMMGRMARLLIKAINENGGAFRKLNIDVAEFAATGKNITQVIEGITKATDSMGPAQKAATLNMLGFEARTQQAILPLLGMTDKIRKYEQELRKAGGTTKDVAEKQLASFAAQMKIVWNRITEVAIEIGAALAPVVSFLASALTTLMDIWGVMPGILKTTIALMIGATAAAGAFALGLGAVATAAGMAIPALVQLNKVIPLAGALGPLKAAGKALTFVNGKMGAMVKAAGLVGSSWGAAGIAVTATAVSFFKIGQWIGDQITGQSAAAKKHAAEQKRIIAEVAAMTAKAPKPFTESVAGYSDLVKEADELYKALNPQVALLEKIGSLRQAVTAAGKDGHLKEVEDLNLLLDKELKLYHDILNAKNKVAETKTLSGAGLAATSYQDLAKEVGTMYDSMMTKEQTLQRQIIKRETQLKNIQALVASPEGAHLAPLGMADVVKRKIEELTKALTSITDKRVSDAADKLKKAREAMEKPLRGFMDGLETRFKTPLEKLQDDLAMLQEALSKKIIDPAQFEKYSKLLKEDASPISSGGIGRGEQRQATALSSNISTASLLRGRQDFGPKAQLEETKKTNAILKQNLIESQKANVTAGQTKEAVEELDISPTAE